MQFESQHFQNRLKRGGSYIALASEKLVNRIGTNARLLDEAVGSPSATVNLFLNGLANHGQLLRELVTGSIKYVRISRANNPEPCIVAKHDAMRLVTAGRKRHGVGKADKRIWLVSQAQTQLDSFRVSHA